MSNNNQIISGGKLNEILQSVAAGEKLDSSIEAVKLVDLTTVVFE